MNTQIHSIISEAGKIALNLLTQDLNTSHKTSHADLITIADLSVNEYLISEIQRHYPDHHIHSEEQAEDINPGHEYQWIIDPIDGTRNFANGIPSWCVMIALLHHGEAVASAVYQPITQELYFAERGKGATRNGKPIAVNSVDTLDKALGILCCDSGGVELERYRRAMHRYVDSTAWLHNHGSMLSACHLAAGGVDLLLNNYGYPHDYWPIYLICKEAGAVVTNSKNEPWSPADRDIVIANPSLHPKVLELFE
jgi:fructose-1,6-bisphosphatase/inositol monophosphatase family enzyme